MNSVHPISAELTEMYSQYARTLTPLLVSADWAKAPAWAQWWACDPNGDGCWFQEEPVLSLTVSYCGWVAKTINGVQIGDALWSGNLEIPFGVDWRLLKEPRPATMPTENQSL